MLTEKKGNFSAHQAFANKSAERRLLPPFGRGGWCRGDQVYIYIYITPVILHGLHLNDRVPFALSDFIRATNKRFFFCNTRFCFYGVVGGLETYFYFFFVCFFVSNKKVEFLFWNFLIKFLRENFFFQIFSLIICEERHARKKFGFKLI